MVTTLNCDKYGIGMYEMDSVAYDMMTNDVITNGIIISHK